jgi:hypothetical protein
MTVGDMLSQGGKQLTAAEIKPLLSGVNLEGRAVDDSSKRFQVAYNPDGTFKGTMLSGQGTFDGTWEVTANDQLCTALRTGSRSTSPCAYVYSLDGRYFISESNAPTASVHERKLSR